MFRSPTRQTCAALATQDPSHELQPFAERIRVDTGVDFITIMNPDGIRYTHPNPARIGERFLGHTEEALAGRLLTETCTGTLGPSMRAVTPVFGEVVTTQYLLKPFAFASLRDKLEDFVKFQQRVRGLAKSLARLSWMTFWATTWSCPAGLPLRRCGRSPRRWPERPTGYPPRPQGGT